MVGLCIQRPHIVMPHLADREKPPDVSTSSRMSESTGAGSRHASAGPGSPAARNMTSQDGEDTDAMTGVESTQFDTADEGHSADPRAVQSGQKCSYVNCLLSPSIFPLRKVLRLEKKKADNDLLNAADIAEAEDKDPKDLLQDEDNEDVIF